MRRLSVLIILMLAASCRREAEAPPPAPAATAPPAIPPGSGPPPTTVPSTTGEARRPALALGAAMPEVVSGVQLAVAGGQPLSLGQARRDEGLLVVFTCNSCPYARLWEKRLVALGNEYAALGLGVVFVNPNVSVPPGDESLEAMNRRVEEHGYRFPYATDATGDVARAFGAARTPEAFLFDSAGNLAYHGAVDDNAQEASQVTAYWLEDALAALVSGQPIPVAETKALGCALKLAPKAS